MAAFERIKTGIPELDDKFDNIRLGDNVVWHVSDLEDFKIFSAPFVKQALKDKRNVIYIRFAQHEPLIDLSEEEIEKLNKNCNKTNYGYVKREDGLKIYKLNPLKQFENFTVEVRNIITKEGIDAFYVFDCLSDLQVAWSTDLMMGNFFRVTCPYLFKLDTVAYFPILRGKHSFDSIAKIRDTTQLLIDIYAENEDIYIHPLKVWNRYSQTMFLGHHYNKETEEVLALKDGLGVSKYYKVLNKASSFHNKQASDSWENFFTLTRLKHEVGENIQKQCEIMCNIMMTKDKNMREKIQKYFEPEDYFSVFNRMIGSGMIGGKACGMLLARKIIEKDRPDLYTLFEPDDSFYIGSDLFYTYIVSNDLWDLRVEQNTKEGYYEAGSKLKKALQNGSFTEDIRDKFRTILDYFGQNPIIVRSSSFLEDGFGNAFAGKYESIFCVNRGTLEERLEDFEKAVKTVYASTMDISALEYRTRNQLDDSDEQMALLVQRVSGSYYENYFFPTAAGVGFSYSPYCPLPDMDNRGGMLRLVMGLGTKAVDRTQQDYPRIINLDKPLAVTMPSVAERHKYSQHSLDLLDLINVHIKETTIEEGLKVIPPYAKKALIEHDTDAERRLRERGKYREVVFVSCEGLVKNEVFTEMMKEVLKTLEEAYDYPVDIEYTINVGESNTFVVNLLQCRPLKVSASKEKVEIPKTSTGKVYFHIKDSSMGRSREEDIDVICAVDPRKYYEYHYTKKSSIARVIGEVNNYYKKLNKKCMLIVPGRIGTSSPELGIPVVFADISQFSAILEVSYSEVGYVPELSFGSHMFQDLVEADIYYGAIFENEKRLSYNDDLIFKFENQLNKINPKLDEDIISMIHVCELDDVNMKFYHDMEKDESLCILKKDKVN